MTPRTARKIPTEVRVHRTDPVYNAHAYLTKVPVGAIEPFIKAFTEPGDLVLDVFAGSGMTGVAAAILGRRAILYDISVLGQHIGRNYLNLVDAEEFRIAAQRAIQKSSNLLGDVYTVPCQKCGRRAFLSRRTWSQVIQCNSCNQRVNYYRALEAAGWGTKPLACPHCLQTLMLRNAKRVGEEVVLDTIVCKCSRTQQEQSPADLPPVNLAGLTIPQAKIESHRQMFQASALQKHGLTNIASFYSPRNLAVLAAMRQAIEAEEDEGLRHKLLFAFTSVLTRASKRYQWSKKRPLNAANQNYYIAMVFYEWNVYDLFQRKVEAMAKSDAYVVDAMGGPLMAQKPDVEYRLGSADSLNLPDASVDYIFTDPPFGSNIFYSDMNLFQEAWLGRFTDESLEAVVDRTTNGHQPRTAERYAALLTASLKEAHRVLKPTGWLSLVFSNSSGDIWALLQRAIRDAGFVIEPDGLSLLDKGQRSVKGLASGFEDVVTVDLVLSMRKASASDPIAAFTSTEIDEALDEVLATGQHVSPSYVYLNVIRECLRKHWDLAPISFSAVTKALQGRGLDVDPATGLFVAG